MKKNILLAAIAAILLFAFSSCEGFLEQILGSADIVLNDPQGGTFYAPDGPAVDSLHFSSSVSDAIATSDTTSGYLTLGANIDLTQADVLAYPYLGVNVSDTLAGVHALDSITLETLYRLNVGNLLTSIANTNLVVLAVADTAWYVSCGGTVDVTTLGTYGHLTEGQLLDIQMFYLTQSGIDHISDLMDRAANLDPTAVAELANFNFNTFFPKVTLTGNYSSRRMNIGGLVSSLSQNKVRK